MRYDLKAVTTANCLGLVGHDWNWVDRDGLGFVVVSASAVGGINRNGIGSGLGKLDGDLVASVYRRAIERITHRT